MIRNLLPGLSSCLDAPTSSLDRAVLPAFAFNSDCCLTSHSQMFAVAFINLHKHLILLLLSPVPLSSETVFPYKQVNDCNSVFAYDLSDYQGIMAILSHKLEGVESEIWHKLMKAAVWIPITLS